MSTISGIEAGNKIFREYGKATNWYCSRACVSKELFCVFLEGQGKREKKLSGIIMKKGENTAFSTVFMVHGYEQEEKKNVSERLPETKPSVKRE